ncbi:MAG: hypothetical protein H0Z24_09950 [Thermosipho sp. (in: Bacteria)]|nr:hypothetical protein [Thermosipho sp. (in: thermotogales)]
MFLIGIDQMSREEKLALLSQLNSLTGVSVLNEGFQRTAKTIKNKALDFITNTFKKIGISEQVSSSIQRFNEKTDWNPNVIQARINVEYERLTKLTDAQLKSALYDKVASISGVDKDAGPKAVARGIIHLAAKAVGINPAIYQNDTILEAEVNEACIKEQVDNLKETLAAMSKEDMERFKEILNQEIARLSSADREAIKKATGLETLSSDAMISYLKTLSGTAFLQLAGGALGFGLYMFLSTALSALSLLFGITFPFALYTTASSIAAFMLSGPFFFLVAGLTGVIMLHKTNQRLNEQLAKILVVAGNAKLNQG